MGRSYWFECSRCGYRARVSGRTDRGLDFFVQTILCRDCKELYDAVTRIRYPLELRGEPQGKVAALGGSKLLNQQRPPQTPPSFLSALNRLPFQGVRRFRWLEFQPRCPVSSFHRVQNWTEPDKCPRCGLYLEKNVLPYRVWE